MLVAAVSYSTVAQGAFYAHQFRVLALLVGVALALAVVLGRREAGPVHPCPWMLGGLAGVAVVSGWSSGNLAGAAPTLALLGVLWAAFAVARRAGPVQREAVVTALVALGVAAAATGVAAVALRRPPLALVDEGLWRASSTLTYANATAGFLLVPLFLALGRVVHGRQPGWSSLAAYALVVGLLSTLSRGGMLGLAAGMVVLAASAGPRRVAARTWAIFAGAAVGVLGILPGMPDRFPARPGIAAAGAAAGAVVVLVAQRRGGARVVATLSAAAAVGAVLSTGLDVGADLASTRVTAASPHRLDGWGAAVGVFADRPVLGAGPGNATYAYVDDDGRSLVTRFVHNEYLQLLAETGLAGLAVVAAGLGLTVRRLAGRPGRDTAVGLGALAGLVAFGVHSALDFLWHVPVLPLTAMLLVGIAADRGIRTGDAPAVDAREPLPAS